MRKRAHASVLAGLAALLTPDRVAACAVCFSATDETRQAFLGTTIGLSLLPLAMVGGVVWWLRRRFVRERDRHAAGSSGG